RVARCRARRTCRRRGAAESPQGPPRVRRCLPGRSDAEPSRANDRTRPRRQDVGVLLLSHHWARDVLWGVFLSGALAEIIATDRRKGDLPAKASSRDRGTKQILVWAMASGLFGGAVLV